MGLSPWYSAEKLLRARNTHDLLQLASSSLLSLICNAIGSLAVPILLGGTIWGLYGSFTGRFQSVTAILLWLLLDRLLLNKSYSLSQNLREIGETISTITGLIAVVSCVTQSLVAALALAALCILFGCVLGYRMFLKIEQRGPRRYANLAFVDLYLYMSQSMLRINEQCIALISYSRLEQTDTASAEELTKAIKEFYRLSQSVISTTRQWEETSRRYLQEGAAEDTAEQASSVLNGIEAIRDLLEKDIEQAKMLMQVEKKLRSVRSPDKVTALIRELISK